MGLRVSYDIGSLGLDAGKRAGWPLAFCDIKALNRLLQTGLAALVREESNPDLQDILAIATPAILVTLLTEATVSLTLSRAQEQEISFVYSKDCLASELAEGHAASSGNFYKLLTGMFSRVTSMRWDTRARDMAHSIISNRGLRISGPEALVVNHNALLRYTARAPGKTRIRYRSPARIFRSELAKTPPALAPQLIELGEVIVAMAATALARFGTALSAIHTQALAKKTGEWLCMVAADRASLDQGWQAPAEIWTGTGGNYTSRQLRAAVRRQGGRVTGFEHGGGGHIHRNLGAETMNEFWIADRFVADTDAKAAVYRKALAGAPHLLGKPPVVEGAMQGASPFSWRNSDARRPVRRVLYVTTAFVGETCYPIQPLLPDPVYADWQGRLVDGLSQQGFEVLIRQHPEGLASGKPLAMSRNGAFLTGSFEEAMDAADAFILDYPATTTLWEAICSDKPVLFIDFGLADWNLEVRHAFEKRCAVVSGGFDAANLPQVDFAAIREAIENAPMDDEFAATYLIGRARS